MTTLIRAIAFLPSGPIDDVFANQCIAHCAHRGYEVAGLVRGDWPTALSMLAAGLATVVVFARQEHLDAEWEPRVEFCGETTQALFRREPGPDVEPGRRGRLI
jgi:hypothetical protein